MSEPTSEHDQMVDEIERLRAVVEALRGALDRLIEHHESVTNGPCPEVQHILEALTPPAAASDCVPMVGDGPVWCRTHHPLRCPPAAAPTRQPYRTPDYSGGAAPTASASETETPA